MFKIIFICILLMNFIFAPSGVCLDEKMTIADEVLNENEKNTIPETINNATTGGPLSATIFVNNSLSCFAAPVVGIFDVDATSGNEICVGAGMYSGNITDQVKIISPMDDSSNQATDGFTAGNTILFKMGKAVVIQVSKEFNKTSLTGLFLQKGCYVLNYEYFYRNNKINGSNKFIKSILI